VDACWLPLPPAGSGSGGAQSAAAGGTGGGGALFLDIVKREEQWAGDPADQERFVRWGYRFEALCTAQPVADPNQEYNVLLAARVARHRLLLGAELDCYDPQLHPGATGSNGSDGGGGFAAASGPAAGGVQAGGSEAAAAAAAPPPPPPASWLELKTYRLPRHAGQQRTLHAFKHPKWWLQSFLAGVPRLALGGRDDEVGAGCEQPPRLCRSRVAAPGVRPPAYAVCEQAQGVLCLLVIGPAGQTRAAPQAAPSALTLNP
jgi:RAT1-interacting protein